MASSYIRREILAVLMESPFYFTIPLRKRLEFLKLFSQQSLTLAPNWLVGSDSIGRSKNC